MGSSNLKKILIATIILIVLGLAGCKYFVGGNTKGYEEAIENVCDAIEKSDMDKYSECMEKSYLAYDSSQLETIKFTEAAAITALKSAYGDNLDISIDVTETNDLMKSAKEKGEEQLEKLITITGMAKDEVDELYSIKYNYKVKGSTSSTTGDSIMMVVESDDKWYVLDDVAVTLYMGIEG